jgi:hypothetical protein
MDTVARSRLSAAAATAVSVLSTKALGSPFGFTS